MALKVKTPMKRRFALVLMAIVAALLIACTPTGGNEPVAGDRPTPTSEPVAGDPTPATPPDTIAGVAAVDDVAILIMESWPLQVQVSVEGLLPDGCTSLGEPEVTREGTTFDIKLPTVITVGVDCIDAMDQYVTGIPLDVLGLPAGTYTVDVNGVMHNFTLTQDNIIPGGDSGQLDDEDRRALVLETLAIALNEEQLPDLQLLRNQGPIVLSTEGIETAWLDGSDYALILMTPEEIQAKANAEGDFLHLRFDLIEGFEPERAMVRFSNAWAVAANSEVGHLSGGGFEVHFTRTESGWEGEIVSMWIS